MLISVTLLQIPFHLIFLEDSFFLFFQVFYLLQRLPGYLDNTPIDSRTGLNLTPSCLIFIQSLVALEAVT